MIDWVMRDRGVSFRHAVELLRSDLPPAAVVEAKPSSPALPAPVEADAEDEELLRQVVGFYHETLKESPEALEYLESRGLQHPEVIERFQLGFANRTLGYRLPPKAVSAGAEIRGRLQGLGILRESGHEHFNGSLVIPVFDGEGRVVEIYGRKITARLRKGTPLHLYLPGPHRGVFNLPALAASPELILCESLIDALTFWCAGYRNVTAAYGINGFTEEMLEAFLGHGIERVLDRLRPGRRRRGGGGEAGREADRRRHRLLPGPVSPRDGRQRVRLEGDAGGEVARRWRSARRRGWARARRRPSSWARRPSPSRRRRRPPRRRQPRQLKKKNPRLLL